MKRSWKAGITVLTLSCMCITAGAQLKGFSIGGYVESAWPAGSFETTHRTGLGAGINADVKLPGKWGVTGSAGYMYFRGRTEDLGDAQVKHQSLTAVPIRLGLKYRIAPLLYLKMESGTARVNRGYGSGVILSPGIGIRVLGIDLQGKYERWLQDEKFSFWGIKAGLNF